MAHRDHVAIEIDARLAEAREQSRFTAKCCIYGVPHGIRQLNEDAYTPQVVSIGPFHRGNTKLLNMEGHKLAYCQCFVDSSEESLDNLVHCVRALEPEVRSCYSETIELGVDELVKVILVDCGFVIELFLSYFNRKLTRDNIFSGLWLGYRMGWDLLLLENQLPFFVFDKLYNLAFKSRLNDRRTPPFLELAFNFFKHHQIEGVLPSSVGSIVHFTDLLRTIYMPSDTLNSTSPKPLTHRYSASELHEAGVKFTVSETGSDGSPGFQFEDCTLKISPIEVYDETESLLRNMIAFEQCHNDALPDVVTNYAEMLDWLINTDKDVDVLVKHGIIVNLLGDNNRAAKLFNGLMTNIVSPGSNFEYRQICVDLNAFHQNCWYNMKATLKRDYCNTAWKTVASIAGIALLILTVIQTACSILQVV